MQPLELKLTIDEVNLALEALGQMPYVRVQPLIAKIHEQAAPQINVSDVNVSDGAQRLQEEA